ncbi:hypothetical protein N7535_004900 [Penicillium sp. DV-2018c]|nr:hypothetical protein N7535_004900 [Penicillium sp. DV-2018c]
MGLTSPVYYQSVSPTAFNVTLTDGRMEDDEEVDKENRPSDLEQHPIVIGDDEKGKDLGECPCRAGDHLCVQRICATS